MIHPSANMKSGDITREVNILDEIARTSNAIRKKYEMIKLNRETTSQTADTFLKPIMDPIQKLMDKTIKQEVTHSQKKRNIKHKPKSTIKKGTADESDNSISTVVEADIEDLDGASVGMSSESSNLLPKYLSLVEGINNKKNVEHGPLVRKIRNRLMIGEAPITFDDNTVFVKNMKFPLTGGLLELLFREKPDNALIETRDLEDYGRIVSLSGSKRTSYQNSSRKSKSTDSLRHIGMGLPKYMLVKNSNVDYVYWDNPNELVDRLRLLLASQQAGNLSHTNEIMSIIEELKEGGIIY